MSEPQTVVPEWLATLVGRLVIENEAMRLALAQLQPQPTQPDKE